MTKPLRILTLLFVAGLPWSASAGIWEGGNPEGGDIRGALKDLRVKMSGKINGFKLTGRHGRTVEVRLPRPQALDAPLVLPPGDWAEITLILEGPVTVRSALSVVQLDLESLTVALEDPEARVVQLDWTLPADPYDLDDDQLIVALEDGALALSKD